MVGTNHYCKRLAICIIVVYIHHFREPTVNKDATKATELLRRPAITPKEALEILPLSKNALYDGIRRGEIESIRVGKRILVLTAPLRRKLGIETL
jgi:hypothetical protein